MRNYFTETEQNLLPAMPKNFWAVDADLRCFGWPERWRQNLLGAFSHCWIEKPLECLRLYQAFGSITAVEVA